MRVIGIDPGKTGAIALICTDLGVLGLLDMPIAGKEVSPQLIGSWLRDWAGRDVNLCVIEDVRSSPQMGVVSAFNFGRSKGVIEGAVAACRFPVEKVTPAKWKRDMRLSSDKDEARAMALEMWPDAADEFSRKKDADRAEACLLAVWGIRQLAERGAA